MYQNFISHCFANQSGITVLVNWPHAHCRVPKLTEASSLGRILRGRHQGMRLWNSVDVKWLWRTLQSSGRHEHDAEHDEIRHSSHSSRVTLNQRCFAFILPRTPLVSRFHVISRTQSHSAVFGCSPSTARRCLTVRVDSWATSVLVGLNMDRTGGTDWHKNKV